MNKVKLRLLEEKAGSLLAQSGGIPMVWRPEAGKLAIQSTPFILDRLQSLGREVVYSPYVFSAVLVDPTDSEIVDRVEDSLLYLRGLQSPIAGMMALTWADEIDHNKG
jgi:hypothetical protein